MQSPQGAAEDPPRCLSTGLKDAVLSVGLLNLGTIAFPAFLPHLARRNGITLDCIRTSRNFVTSSPPVFIWPASSWAAVVGLVPSALASLASAFVAQGRAPPHRQMSSCPFCFLEMEIADESNIVSAFFSQQGLDDRYLANCARGIQV